jgi:hypothetical protein
MKVQKLDFHLKESKDWLLVTSKSLVITALQSPKLSKIVPAGMPKSVQSYPCPIPVVASQITQDSPGSTSGKMTMINNVKESMGLSLTILSQ